MKPKENVVNLSPASANIERGSGDGGDSGMSDLEKRVLTIENKMATRDDVQRLSADVKVLYEKMGSFETRFASKDDVTNIKVEIHKDFNSQTWKLVMFVFIAIASSGGLYAWILKAMLGTTGASPG